MTPTPPALDTEPIGSRRRIGYRVRWRSPEEGAQVFEQQAHYDVGDAGISWLHLVCSGDHAVASG